MTDARYIAAPRGAGEGAQPPFRWGPAERRPSDYRRDVSTRAPRREDPQPTRGGVSMADRTQRLKGKANEAAGKTKAAAGYQTRSGKTEAKGAAQAAKGKTQQTVGKARSEVKKKTR